EAIQRTLLYGKYQRNKSWFPNSDFGAAGPPDAAERAILEPYRDQIRPEVLSRAWEPPRTDGSGNNRDNLRTALRLFREAGWELKDGRLIETAT
ncbi:hypothetical protein, partial [Streptomyces acidiscabies]|uniref:hypothetical protein n=1 Tax=Streptomyces acidiscabies TaxID=42234 RepID=UPI0038F703B3